MIVLIDNYDSFTFNLFHYLGGLGSDVLVYRNDKVAADRVMAMEPEAIVLSPGPRTPSDAGICPSPSKGDGYEAWCKDTSPTTPCQATPTRSQPSAPRSGGFGSRRCGAEASEPDSTGSGWTASQNDGYHPLV